MSDPRPEPAHRARSSMLVATYTGAWTLAALIATLAELIATGSLTTPVAALDIVSVVQLPFGLLSLALTPLPANDPPAAEDDSDGGGGGNDRRPPDELPPSGGLSLDWERFEADFRAYARDAELVA